MLGVKKRSALKVGIGGRQHVTDPQSKRLKVQARREAKVSIRAQELATSQLQTYIACQVHLFYRDVLGLSNFCQSHDI